MVGKTYTINITHLMQDKTRTFFIFQEMPRVVNDPSGQIFANIFQFAPEVVGQSDGSSTLQFSMVDEFFAIFGTKKGTEKASVTTSSYKPINLGPNGSVVALTSKNNAPSWNQPKFSDDFAGAGGFKFLTDDSFDSSNPTNIFIGVGGADPNNGKVIPLQTWAAEPSLTSQLFPKVTYYVGTGSYTPGQFVDKKDIGKYLQIDFQTATGNAPFVNINFTANGNFEDDKNHPASSRGIKVRQFDNS